MGGSGGNKTDNDIEKTVNNSVKVNENSKPENVDDKPLLLKNDKDEVKSIVNTEKVISDKDTKNVEKDNAKTNNEIDKSNGVNDVSDKENNEVVSDKEKSCDIKAKTETKESKVDESKSVPEVKGAVDESKTEENKDSKPITNGHIPNGHIPRQENNVDKDLKPKKVFGKSPTPTKTLKFDTKDSVNEISLGESAASRNGSSSRASSVSTNRSRTCSPSGPNRGISSKLASICKMLEDDVSEKSSTSKSRSVSRSSSGLGTKIGKINNLSDMFEKDKMANKPPPEKDPNSVVGKLLRENPYSPAFDPDPRPPVTLKTKGKIGGCDITKFGEVSKPTKSLLAAKKAEVLKRTEELKKKNESLKA